MCCYPWDIHTKIIKGSRLKTLDFGTADIISELIKRRKIVADGMKICYNVCNKRLNDEIESQEEPDFNPEPEDEDAGPSESTNPVVELNASLNAIGVSAVKVLKYAKGQRNNYIIKKQERVAEAVKKRISEIGDTPTSADRGNVKKDIFERKAQDLDTLCTLLKGKISTSAYQDQIRLLTLAPTSWTHKEVAEYFEIKQKMKHKILFTNTITIM